MTEKEWDMYDPIELAMKEASMQAEVESTERRLKWCWEMIENRGKKRAGSEEQTMKQVSKQDRELAMKEAMCNWDE